MNFHYRTNIFNNAIGLHVIAVYEHRNVGITCEKSLKVIIKEASRYSMSY